MFIQGVLGDHCDIVPQELGYHRKRFLGADTVVMLLARDREPVLDPKGHGAVLETRNENLLAGQTPHGRID